MIIINLETTKYMYNIEDIQFFTYLKKMNLPRRVKEYDNRRIHNSVLSSLIAIFIFISIQDLEYPISDLTNQLYSQVRQTAPTTIPRNSRQSSTHAFNVQSIRYKKSGTLSKIR